MSLARTDDKKLSLFLIDVKKVGSSIHIARLKSKLGTHALPTAELELDHVQATLLGTTGQGVKINSTILNITRIWTALTAVSYLRRAYAIVEAYSKVRMIGSSRLIEKPLQARLLASTYVKLSGLLHLTFYTIQLLGKEEYGTASDTDKSLLRILTPLVKAYVAKNSHLSVAECCEMLGGLGYIENVDFEFNLARIYRDSLVVCIWEGTSSVLALDFARTLKSKAARDVFVTRFPIATRFIDNIIRNERDLRQVMFTIADMTV